MPEMPDAMRERFEETYGLSYADAAQLTHERGIAEFFETTARITANPKLSANWVVGELTRELNSAATRASDSPVTAEDLAELLITIEAGKIRSEERRVGKGW